ncbi:MAG: hypothetical protein WB760_01390 [Xanthobacteraceae bacterium]
MDRTNLSTPAPRGFAVLLAGWRSVSVLWWMAAAFLVCLLLAAAVLAVFGAGERGTVLALRLTARWCFVLFWFAYAGGPLAKLWNLNLFAELARHGREFGLAFASALAVHVALILWHYHIATPPDGAMLFFWVGVFCAYLLALFSLPGVRDALGPRAWRIILALALEYIALVFAVDFIFDPLQAAGVGKYPLSYVPFVVMLVGGVLLRMAAFARTSLGRERAVS